VSKFLLHNIEVCIYTCSLSTATFQHSHPTLCGSRTNHHNRLPCSSGSTERTILIQLEES